MSIRKEHEGHLIQRVNRYVSALGKCTVVNTQILSSGTSIAKEHVGTGVGETGGKRLADAMIKALQKPLQVDRFWRRYCF